MSLRFLLICEGSSDAALIPHISKLLLKNGHSDPQGIAWHGTGPLTDKVGYGLEYSGGCELLLVHRDADSDVETPSAGPRKRAEEIEAAVLSSGYIGPWAGIVPVRMTEAWLLLDESAIRQVTGRPNGNLPLGLPDQILVERESDPKGCLEQSLIAASEATGRRLTKFRRDLPHLRRLLLEHLPVGGPLEQVPSWLRFRRDLTDALEPKAHHQNNPPP